MKGKAAMARYLSRTVAIAAAAALAWTAPAADAAPKPHKPPPARQPQAVPAPPAAEPPRVVYSVEQLVTGALPPTVQTQLGPLHTLREVEDLLKAYDIAFKWNKIELRSAELQPDMVKQIDALPPGEVFVVPQGQPLGQIMVFNVILRTRPE
ncbi:MAG: hypothetical protein ACXWKV_16600 [Caulobacteraceae bacterium]